MTMNAPLSPGRILQVGIGFWQSQVLLSAVALDLFTVLGPRAMTAQELGDALSLSDRARLDFFDALVALRFLDRDGDGAGARYRNGAEAALFLDKAKPGYMGGILEMAQARLYPFWADLKTALQTGKPQNEIKHSGKPMFDELYAEPARLEQFMRAMTGASRGNFAAFVDAFDFSRFRSYCDIGGATGLLAGMVADAAPHLDVASFDLPAVAPIATRSLAERGLAGRVKVLSGDFLKQPLPKADLISMGMILHDWNLQGKMHLIRAAYDALPEGGAFIAIEHLIDDARRENVFGLMMSLNMLVEFGDAFDFSAADFEGWCREVGFKRFERMTLTPVAGAVVAYK
jgi:predicted O-methyltransferase YrrM